MAGVVTGAVFDIYRAFRKWSGWGRIATFIGDILFSFVALIILFLFLQKANWLDLRSYTVWGSILGLAIYLKLLSRTMVRLHFTLLRFLSYLGHLTLKGLKLPFIGLSYLMRPPYAILRWISMLFYRMGEAFVEGPVRAKVYKARSWWETHIGPRTKG